MSITPLDPAARQLAADNINLARWAVGRLHSRVGGDFDDMLGDAMLGLCVAARSFDPTRGFKFSTYAVHCIYQKIADGSRRDRKGRGEWNRRDGQTDTVLSLTRLADDGYDQPADDDPERDVVGDDYCAWLLGHLTENERAAILTHGQRGAATTLAEQCGVTRAMVGLRKKAAKDRLRGVIERVAA